jgi:hypothetical protein
MSWRWCRRLPGSALPTPPPERLDHLTFVLPVATIAVQSHQLWCQSQQLREFTYVPEILETLEAPGTPPFLDRPTVEVLFGVRRRQAIQLLRRFGGYQVGRAFLVPRKAVIGFLRDPPRWRAAADEKGRFERVANTLGQARRELRQPRIPIPAPTEALAMELAGLPSGIRLETGQLIIQFERPVELLEKLFALSQALTHDYEAFERSWNAAGQAAGGAMK